MALSIVELEERAVLADVVLDACPGWSHPDEARACWSQIDVLPPARADFPARIQISGLEGVHVAA